MENVYSQRMAQQLRTDIQARYKAIPAYRRAKLGVVEPCHVFDEQLNRQPFTGLRKAVDLILQAEPIATPEVIYDVPPELFRVCGIEESALLNCLNITQRGTLSENPFRRVAKKPAESPDMAPDVWVEARLLGKVGMLGIVEGRETISQAGKSIITKRQILATSPKPTKKP